MRQASTRAHQPHVVRAPHAGQAFDMIEKNCRAAVGVGAVHHLAHYSYGVLNLSVDVLDGEELASRLPGTLTAERRRRDLVYAGRQLNYIMRDTGRSLEHLRSGRLIRAVFDTRAGASFFFEVRPDEYLVGVTFDRAAVLPADMAMAKAVQQIRKDLRLGDPNPGGFNPLPDDRAPAWGGRPFVDGYSTLTEADNLFIDAGGAVVHPRDLHFIARFEKGAWRCSVDALDDRSLDLFFQSITRRRRREGYQHTGRQFQSLSTTMDRALRGVMGRRTTDSVLDVEEGAIYFRRIRPDICIMGVTLDQSQVHQAQVRFTELADQIESRRA